MEIHTIGGSRRRGEDMAVDMYIRARGRTTVITEVGFFPAYSICQVYRKFGGDKGRRGSKFLPLIL